MVSTFSFPSTKRSPNDSIVFWPSAASRSTLSFTLRVASSSTESNKKILNEYIQKVIKIGKVIN